MQLFTSLFVAVASCVLIVTAQDKRICVTGALTGVNIHTKARPSRININDLYQNGGAPWDLYVQALAELQAMDESDELSYFQVMGIHGLPFIEWNGVGQVPGGNDRAGFCPHGQLLFGLWHRPYLALFEQLLVEHAVNISNRYTGDDAPVYRTTAQSIRIAYWDWATDDSLPEAVTSEIVTVNGPTGNITLKNPFYSYRFQNFPFNSAGMDAGTLSTQDHTTRCPDIDLVDDVEIVNQNMNSSGNLKDQVYDVFTTIQPFQYVVTTYDSNRNFESPHNNVHSSIGCSNGTMWDLNWSAFDPIFMLHHANVDRLIALWQAIYYNSSIFNNTDYQTGLFGTAAGDVDVNTPLKPFYGEDGNFHTSSSVQDIKTFGYTYPELTKSDMVSQADLSSYVKYKVNSLYSAEGVSITSSRFRNNRNKMSRGQSSSAPVGKKYSIEMQIEKSEILLPASVDCYVAEKVVGRMALLAMPSRGISRASIPLNGPLSAVSMNLEGVEVVIPYLNQTLRVEVRQGDGTLVDVDSLPSLQVVVQDRDYTPRTSDHDFPTYGSTTTHHDVGWIHRSLRN